MIVSTNSHNFSNSFKRMRLVHSTQKPETHEKKIYSGWRSFLSFSLLFFFHVLSTVKHFRHYNPRLLWNRMIPKAVILVNTFYLITYILMCIYLFFYISTLSQSVTLRKRTSSYLLWLKMIKKEETCLRRVRQFQLFDLITN